MVCGLLRTYPLAYPCNYSNRYNNLKINEMENLLIKELQKQENANINTEYRNLKAIKAGGYMLSVQGSNGHYCSPRLTLPVDIYAEMELAIINKRGAMISINKSKLFRKFKRYDELLSRIDGPNTGCAVYGYVSVELLNELYCFLNKT